MLDGSLKIADANSRSALSTPSSVKTAVCCRSSTTLLAGLLAVDFFALLQLRNNCVSFVILAVASSDGPEMINGVRASSIRIESPVDYGVVVPRCTHVARIKFHVVAQVVEAEFVVGAVGDVGSVSGLALKVVHVVLNTTDLEAEKRWI